MLILSTQCYKNNYIFIFNTMSFFFILVLEYPCQLKPCHCLFCPIYSPTFMYIWCKHRSNFVHARIPTNRHCGFIVSFQIAIELVHIIQIV